MKIAIVDGTRPEAIKMAPLYWAMTENIGFTPTLINTGQHSDLMDETLSSLNITADFDLFVMKDNQGLGATASELLMKLTNVLLKTKPDFVLVQGDTSTALMGALAAFYLGIRVGHVEAGLRTKSIAEPFPEEGNRRALSTLSSIDFCPTEVSKKNLLREGKSESTIYVTGNTGIDSLRKIQDKIFRGEIVPSKEIEKLVDLGQYVLVTCHRRESFGDAIQKIMETISKIAQAKPGTNFIFPVHPNPNVKSVVERELSNIQNVHLIKPVAYVDFVHLLNHCLFVISDSGGLQEEAPALGKRIVVLREDTERSEAVDEGYAFLVGSSPILIAATVNELLSESLLPLDNSNIFGDGEASNRILKILAGV